MAKIGSGHKKAALTWVKTASSGVARAGVEPATFRFSGGRSYQLSYLAGNAGEEPNDLATLTGLEPATFAVTGRRANQLRHRALLYYSTAYSQRDSNPRCRLERAES